MNFFYHFIVNNKKQMIYRIIKRVFLYVFLYYVLMNIYHNLLILQGMYDKMIQHHSIQYKHTSYLYDCLYGGCFPEDDYIVCKCLLEK